MVSTARAWFGNFIATPKSMTAISTTPNSPNVSPGFHWRYSPVRNGTMATRPTFLGALSKSGGKTAAAVRERQSAWPARHDRHQLFRERSREIQNDRAAD